MRSTRPEWEALADTLTIPNESFVDGQVRPSHTGLTLPSINPATGRVLAEVAACDAQDVDRAVSSGRAAFERGVWSRSPISVRKRVLLDLARLIEENADELALIDSMDMGKSVRDARTMDIPAAAATFAFYAEALDKVPEELAPTEPGNLAYVTRVPLGVVAAITAWNFPLETAAWKLAPALAAGNSVVLKPSERAPLSALRLAELASEAGLPDGVLNVVPGAGTVTGTALALHRDVDALTFTGSTAVGKQLLVYAGQSNMKKVALECGGKSPNVVFADVEDVGAAVGGASDAIFSNQGEVCSANSRLLVHRDLLDVFVDSLVKRANEIELGHPLEPATNMGPLVDAAHADHVAALVASAPDESIVAGGARREIEGSDCYMEPTILADLGTDSPLTREEVFGPVLTVVPFDTEDEAVQIANDSEYGLAASVWTGSLSRALRMSEALRVGTVSINTVDALSLSTPFGGFKQSGHGRDLSLHALDNYTGLKTTWISF